MRRTRIVAGRSQRILRLLRSASGRHAVVNKNQYTLVHQSRIDTSYNGFPVVLYVLFAPSDWLHEAEALQYMKPRVIKRICDMATLRRGGFDSRALRNTKSTKRSSSLGNPGSI